MFPSTQGGSRSRWHRRLRDSAAPAAASASMPHTRMAKAVLRGIVGLTVVCCVGVGVCTPSVKAQVGDLEVLQLRQNFFMIGGAGGNIGVQIGEDGVVVVDAGVAAIKKLSAQPIRYVIDTSADADHVGGNETISKAGQTLFTNPGSIGITGDFLGGVASILSAERVLERMTAPTGRTSPFPVGALPTESFDFPRKYMYLNGEGIEVLHQPAAHSDGDSFVFFRRSDVVAAGDVLDLTRFPVIDVARGGSVQGEIDALNRLIAVAVPPGPFIYE